MIEPWRTLGIDPTGDAPVIRRAYAKRLKEIDPETDAPAFIALREARDRAMASAKAGGGGTFVDAGTTVFDDPVPSPMEDAVAPSGVSEADVEAMRVLHAMILDPEDRSAPGEIAARTETLLDSAAMENLDHAARVEAFLAELIVAGTPRSDPMIDPAMRRFRWDRSADDLRRPWIVDWVSQRRTDIYFEDGLATSDWQGAVLLERLRGRVPTRWPRWTAWLYGPKIERFIGDLQAHHPTTLAALDRDALAWWVSRIGEQRSSRWPLRWLVEWRSRAAAARSSGERDWTSAYGLYVLILVLPWLFVWFLLLPRHGWKERAVGFGYLALLSLLPVISSLAPPRGGSAMTAAASSGYAPAAEPKRFVSMTDDVEELVAEATQGTVTAAEMGRRNPALAALVTDDWERARRTADWQAFRTAARGRMEDVLASALKGTDRKLIVDHARSYASRLRWAARRGTDDCDGLIEGRGGIVESNGFARYQERLVGRAILSGAAPEGRRPERARFTISEDAFSDARRRAGLSARVFRSSLVGGGTATTRCNARIALIDAAVEGGEDGTALLRQMF